MGFDCIVTAPFLPSGCGFFVSRMQIIFGKVPVFFVDGCSVGCDFGVFVRGGELQVLLLLFLPAVSLLLQYSVFTFSPQKNYINEFKRNIYKNIICSKNI